MRFSILFVAALSLASSAIAAKSSGPSLATLARQGSWTVNRTADSCELNGTFGTGADLVTVSILRHEPSNWFDLILLGQSLKRTDPAAEIKIAFGPGRKEQKVLAIFGTSGGVPAALFRSVRLDGWTPPDERQDRIPPPISLDDEARVTELSYRMGKGGGKRLTLGPMDVPMAKMRDCTNQLVIGWGYDPKMISTLSRPVTPKGDPSDWVTASSYPSSASWSGRNGLAKIRLDVDTGGKVTGCNIVDQPVPDEFGKAACGTLSSRAKFKPALDALGDPTRGFYVITVRYLAGF